MGGVWWEVCGVWCVVVCGVWWAAFGARRGCCTAAQRALLPRKSSVGKELRTTSEYRPAGSLASIRASGLRSSGEGEPRSQLIRSAWVSSSALAATAAVAEMAAHGSTSSPAPDCGPSTATAALALQRVTRAAPTTSSDSSDLAVQHYGSTVRVVRWAIHGAIKPCHARQLPLPP